MGDASPVAGRPLSFAQQRLWFIHQLKPDSAVYNIPFAYRLVGPLDVDAMERALREIVRRHHALRTTFTTVRGTPLQVVQEAAFALAKIDLPAGTPDPRAWAAALVEQEARRPFDLAKGPVFRASLLRLGAQEHVLVLNFHHIAFDGWAIGILSREFRALYEAFSAGAPSPLPEPKIQYADFAEWQREHLSGAELERQLAYWRRQLAGLRPHDLPTDRPRPRHQSFRGAAHIFTVPRGTSAAIVRLAQTEKVTPFMPLLAAWQTLLSRYTGQDDIAVGTPIAGRTRRDHEAIIGFFVNTLVMRTDLSGDPTFRELLRRVREMCLDAYTHQEVPFEKIVEELAPQRDMSRSPLFQVLFSLENMPGSSLTLGPVTFEPQHPDPGVSRVDLSLAIEQTPEGLRGRLEYSTSLFDGATIVRLAGHFVTLLEGIVNDPDARLSRLPLLGPHERRLLVDTWNDTRRDYPRDRTVHRLVEEQAARTPDRIALRSGATEVTYRDLDQRANRLAWRLQGMGVGPSTLVALCMERSPEMVVAMLGVLKAGAAYVPLDPAYPVERLSFILEDTRAKVVLAHPHLAARLPPSTARVLPFDAEGERALGTQPHERPPEVETTPEDLVYVIYTSGSTGKPKGVAVPHRGVVRLVHDRALIDVQPDDRFAQSSNATFDVATFDVWTPLVHGASLVSVAKETLLAPHALAAFLTSERITVITMTPALFHQVVREVPSAFRSVRSLLVAGDVMDAQRAAEVLEAGAPQRLINAYGPTESTTYASWFEVKGPSRHGNVPIGKPIANTTLYVLDRAGNLAPIGVPGELHIGGDGLARGYLERPDLTAERFVPDPFRAGSRLYRTGDLARWLPDGNVEFLGRMDHQVKIRGFRVELGEIEAVLCAHPTVREAVVVARAEAGGEKRLDAYVVLRSDAAVPDLKAHLRAKLPEHMVPAAIVRLDAFPLSPNGKIDRQALPLPERERDPVRAREAPRTEIERRIAQAWSEALKTDAVGLDENFFDAGGHSLLIPQLQSRLTELLGQTVPVVAFFEHPTIASLARRFARDEPDPGLKSSMDRGGLRREARRRRVGTAPTDEVA